jgi:hypothetical protein
MRQSHLRKHRETDWKMSAEVACSELIDRPAHSLNCVSIAPRGVDRGLIKARGWRPSVDLAQRELLDELCHLLLSQIEEAAPQRNRNRRH